MFKQIYSKIFCHFPRSVAESSPRLFAISKDGFSPLLNIVLEISIEFRKFDIELLEKFAQRRR